MRFVEIGAHASDLRVDLAALGRQPSEEQELPVVASDRAGVGGRAVELGALMLGGRLDIARPDRRARRRISPGAAARSRRFAAARRRPRSSRRGWRKRRRRGRRAGRFYHHALRHRFARASLLSGRRRPLADIDRDRSNGEAMARQGGEIMAPPSGKSPGLLGGLGRRGYRGGWRAARFVWISTLDPSRTLSRLRPKRPELAEGERRLSDD